MAIILDATVGGASSNAYVTVARGNQLMELLPHATEWFTDETIYPEQLLTHATTLIDRVMMFNGSRTSTSQRLEWPRTGIANVRTGVTIASNIIPEFVELATVEWAYDLYLDSSQAVVFAPGLRSLRTATYDAEFGGSGKRRVPSVVTELLNDYGMRRTQNSVRLVRA
jgi:hypothetical protein